MKIEIKMQHGEKGMRFVAPLGSILWVLPVKDADTGFECMHIVVYDSVEEEAESDISQQMLLSLPTAKLLVKGLLALEHNFEEAFNGYLG